MSTASNANMISVPAVTYAGVDTAGLLGASPLRPLQFVLTWIALLFATRVLFRTALRLGLFARPVLIVDDQPDLTQGADLIGKTIQYTPTGGGDRKTGKVDSVVVQNGNYVLKVGNDSVGLGQIQTVTA